MCILTGIDPIYQLCKIHYPIWLSNKINLYILALFRYALLQRTVNEGFRILLTIVILFLTILKTFMNILKLLGNRQLNRQTILLFNQLHCINQMVIYVFKYFNGMLMGFAFVIIILLNWIIISGGSIFGWEIYAVCAMGNITLSSIMILALEWACQIDEISKTVIQRWKVNTHKQPYSIKYWIRLVKAQQPISLYYGMTKFDKETSSTYYHNIVDYTVNAVLLY